MSRIRVCVFVLAGLLGWISGATAQTVTIDPTYRVVVAADRKLFVTITWCDTAHPYDLYARTITLGGVDVTSNFAAHWNAQACGTEDEPADNFMYVDTGTVTLAANVPSQMLEAELQGPGIYSFYGFAYYMLPDPRRGIVVRPDAQFRDVSPSTSGLKARFSLTNVGNGTDTVSVTKTCIGSISSCTLSQSTLVIAAGATAFDTVTFTSASANDTGMVWLKAVTLSPSYTDSTWTHITSRSAASAGVVIIGTSPGVSNYVARDLCVTIAIADAAAAECGDLRLVHPLPGIQTLGRGRAPTLIYNSQHARTKPLVQADVTLPSSWGTLPTTVTGCIVISAANRGCTSWSASDWGALGNTRRVTVAGDDGTWNTDLYSYTLQITTNRGDSALAATGELPVVNRKGSGLGAGWWLAGLEELYAVSSSRLMVVGGDGTVRVYSSVASNTYTSNNPTHPDTLTGSGSSYTRHAANGVLVHFTSGAHDWTRSALGDTTYFSYSSGHLSNVQIPTRNGSTSYAFSGISSGVQTVTAPGSRTVTIRTTSLTGGFRVDSIEDPDGKRVRFYSNSSADQFRVDSVRNRRSKASKFSYDAGIRLTQVIRPTGITTTLLMAETRGLATALPVDSAFTLINGPRSDVGDTTRLWINGHGAPTRIRDALGHETRVTYDGTFAGLASETVSPNRLRSRAWYNTRGLPDSTRVYDPLGDASNATTRYTWHGVWNMPTQVTSPTGLVSQDSFQTDYPLLSRRRVGSNGARNTDYLYDSHHQLVRVKPPVVAAETLTYDSLGNVNWFRTSLGLVTTSTRDGLGRVTLSTSPYGNTSRTWYSVMDRVDSIRTRGDSIYVSETGRNHPADSVTVVNVYDAEGNDSLTTRRVRLNGSSYNLTTYYYRDDAGRLTGELRPGSSTISYSLDAAGNVTTVTSPRSLSVTVDYDALNRPIRRVVPAASYAAANCILYSCNFTFPTRDGSDHCVGADTSYFAYDAAGNLRRADNGWALVRRGYAPSGLLTHDTLIIRDFETYGSNPCGGGDRHAGGSNTNLSDFSHSYAQSITYDLDGRRQRLYHPNGIDFCASGQCSQKYVYHDTTGALSRLVVEKPSESPDTALFTYDLLGRLTITRHLSGVTDTVAYDADSRDTLRAGPYGASHWAHRDALGRMTSGSSGGYSVLFRYGPMGALVYSENITQGSGYEEFVADGVGNRTWQREYGARDNWPGLNDRRRKFHIDNATLRLDSITWDTTSSGFPGTLMGTKKLTYWAQYDAAGNVQHTAGWEPYPAEGSYAVHLNEAVNWYDAQDRLQAVNRNIDLGPGSQVGGVYEEYRYDALGRRVLVRSRCTSPSTEAMCKGYVERTVYDGDQVLYEIRAPGQDSSQYMESESWSGTNEYDYMLGRAGYVHAGGIDQPLGVYRVGYGNLAAVGVTPHANLLGDYSIGSFISLHRGYSTITCPQNYADCPTITWPGGNITADGQLTGGASFTTWFGNLLSAKSDGSRLQYMRNRYYDPMTGRFTQQDPIGLAGGLNAYGFAAGDPVNFSDPLGLNPDPLFWARMSLALMQLISDNYRQYKGHAAGQMFQASTTAETRALESGASNAVREGLEEGAEKATTNLANRMPAVARVLGRQGLARGVVRQVMTGSKVLPAVGVVVSVGSFLVPPLQAEEAACRVERCAGHP